MKNTAQSRRSRCVVFALLIPLVAVMAGSQRGKLFAFDQTPAATKTTPAEMAVMFLKHLEKAEVGPALQLWEGTSANDQLESRVVKMASKVKKVGGIKKIDVGECEARRVKKFEEKTGEKIDVIPVEIICGDGNLILAVFSVRKTDHGYRIFRLESLKEWGGTASLDDEQQYSH